MSTFVAAAMLIDPRRVLAVLGLLAAGALTLIVVGLPPSSGRLLTLASERR